MTKKILALKYRPQECKDLIGQEVMTQIVTNAIKIGKTPNAYLLTGIRGVGKTTTARLIAKALNCEKNNNTKAENMVMDKLKIHSLVAISLLCSDVLIHPMKNENPIAMERMMSR